MKIKKILPLIMGSMLIFSSCGNKSLEWNMSETDVKKIADISDEPISVDNWSWISSKNQTVYGEPCDVSYNFTNSQLEYVSCYYDYATNKDEQERIAEAIKANIISEYGEPSIDELRTQSQPFIEDVQYYFCEWVTEKTTIRLSYNPSKEDDFDVTLCFYSSAALSEEAATDGNTNSVDGKYLTYTSWSSKTAYLFAVEIDNYGGDILAAGSYTFSVTNTKLGEAPIYDIYIKDNRDYSSISELGEPDFGVGGANSFPITRELKKGSYVYVVPYTGLIYEPKGYLEIELN